jgi:outer membrane protein, heavy metal efflux system
MLTLVGLCAAAEGDRSTGPLASTFETESTVAGAPGQSSQLTDSLTLEQALSLAELYNPQLRGATAQQEGARAGIITARTYPNPDFNFLMGRQHARPIRTPGTPGLLQHYGVTQPVELPIVRRTRISAARYALESSNFGLSGVRRGVRADVKHAFFEVLRRKEEVRYAEQSLGLVQDLRRRTEVQVNVGEAARLELTRAEAEIAIAQTLVRRARLEYIGALSVLRASVSAPLPANVDPIGALDSPMTLPALDNLRTAILSQHPAIAQAKAEVERSRAIVAHEHALRIPQPSAYAEYEEQPDLGFYRVGLTIPLPIWNQRKGQIAEAVAGLNQATAIEDQRVLEITAALERAYGQYQVANQQVVSFEKGALRQAQAALDAAQAAYRFGERGIIEVLDAQRVLQRVRADFLDAQYEREAALIDLELLGAVELEGKKP